MTFSFWATVVTLFAGLFIAGLVACLPLYHWHIKDFLASRLWVKLYFWIPIFIVFCSVVIIGGWAAWLVAAGLLIQAGRELVHAKAWRKPWVVIYVSLFTIALLHLGLYFYGSAAEHVAVALVTICFASVLSDVFAFFGGSYFGKHPLPDFINARKSYEGIVGQLIGAIVGVAAVSLLPGISFAWRLGFIIGVASAIGDLINSIAKRQLGIKDWGNAIPGHGGVLDRFSSLSFALAAGYWYFII